MSRKLVLGLLCGLSLGFFGTLKAEDIVITEQESDLSPYSYEHPLIKQIHALHIKAEQGTDKQFTIDLIDKLEKLSAKYPDNQLIKVYLGSTYTLRGRDIGFGPSAYRYLKDGLKLMDEAVAAEPDKATVRFIRAINNFHLPAIVNRRDNARADFELLVKQVDSGEGQQLSDQTKQAIYYYAGVAFRQLNRNTEAKDSLKKAAKLNAVPALSEPIAKELERLG